MDFRFVLKFVYINFARIFEKYANMNIQIINIVINYK